MKRNLVAGFLLLAIAGAAFAGNMEVGAVNYTPAPAIPGGYMDLYVHVNNNSGVDAKGVVFSLDLDSADVGSTAPFYLDANQAGLRQIGDVRANQSAIVKFRLRVGSQASDGTYTINLEVGEDGKIGKSVPYAIKVQGRRPLLSISDAGPAEVTVGRNTPLVLTIKNTGSNEAFNLTIGLSEERTVTSTGIIVEREIIPMGAANASLDSLGPAASKEVRIPILINPGADARAYFIPIKFEFYDSNKTKYTDTQYVGVKVISPAEIDASLAQIKPALVAGQESAITIDIYNTGMGAAKYMRAKAAGDFGAFRQGEYFIGSLESDDSSSIKIEVQPANDVKPGAHYIDLELAYKDQFGEPFTLKKRLNVTVLSPQQASQGGIGLIPIIMAALLLIAGGGYYMYNRRKGK